MYRMHSNKNGSSSESNRKYIVIICLQDRFSILQYTLISYLTLGFVNMSHAIVYLLSDTNQTAPSGFSSVQWMIILNEK